MSIIPLTTEEFSDQITAYYQKYNEVIKKRIEGKVEQTIKIITRDPTHKTLLGKLEFSEDNTEKTLSFVLTSENRQYTETIFLPISISLQESQKVIQMEIEKINIDILQLLEYGETKEINLEYLKNLKSLAELLKQIKNKQTQRLLLEKNTLLQEEIELIKRDGQLLSELKQHPNQQQLKNQYFANHFKLDHTVKKGEKQLVVAGSTVRLVKDGTEQEISTIISRNEMVLKTGEQITLNDIQVEPGLRFKIKQLKQEEDIVSEAIIKQALQSDPELLAIFRTLMALPETDMNRPCLSYKLMQKTDGVVPKVDQIKYIEPPFVKLIPLQYDPANKILLGSSSTSECSNELLFSKIEDVVVDDFTFRSIAHYQAASQFYNRRDMDENMRQQNNQLFIRFSKEYTGSDSLYDLPVSQLSDLSLFTSLKKSVVWNVDFDDKTPSPASLSLRKAIYAKQNQSSAFKTCLLQTGNAALYRKKARNTYKLCPELMEVREYVLNNEIPPYELFNYDPTIKREFNAALLTDAEQMARKQALEENIQDDLLQARAEEQKLEIQQLKKQIEEQEKQRIASYKRAIYSHKYVSSPIEPRATNSLFTAIIQNIMDQERSNVARGGILPQDLATSISRLHAYQYPNDYQTINSLENMTNTNTHLQLKLLARYFCARIEVVSSTGTDTYSYEDETEQDECPNVKALFSLGRLDGFKQPLFASLLPDLSQRDECIEYLWDTKSNMLLRELPDDEQEYIGLWDPNEISINKTQDMPEMDPNTELTVEILPLCKINDRIYYKSTQVIFK